jgi:Fe-S-cluster containining protein
MPTQFFIDSSQSGSTIPRASDLAIDVKLVEDTEVSCSSCQACCCRLEVMLITDTGVPKEHIKIDAWGGETMLRLDDGWCSAVNRDNYMCSIYEVRPLICREFEMGSYECIDEREVN